MFDYDQNSFERIMCLNFGLLVSLLLSMQQFMQLLNDDDMMWEGFFKVRRG
jgi:hypothetical protein